jgi:hypothetical protein
LVFVRDLKPGDHVRWLGLDMLVEGVRVNPMCNIVSLSAGGRRLGFAWGAEVELVGDA